MSDFSDLIALFVEVRQDIDSVPYAHEDECSEIVAARLEAAR